MAEDDSLDRLWKEYSLVFRDFDDLSLARWMAQTLGQLQGRVWRLSHPLVGAYRLAAQLGHERQIWFKRLATPPAGYIESACCRAPLLPLFTRDILESGLLCQHCAETAVPFDDLPNELRPKVESWANAYGDLHDVAHWEESRQKSEKNYDKRYEQAATEAETFLARAATQLLPEFLDYYPALLWEDHDECLEVRPEDIDVG